MSDPSRDLQRLALEIKGANADPADRFTRWAVLLRAFAAWKARNWDYFEYPPLDLRSLTKSGPRGVATNLKGNGRQAEYELCLLLDLLPKPAAADGDDDSGMDDESRFMRTLTYILRAECCFDRDKPVMAMRDVESATLLLLATELELELTAHDSVLLSLQRAVLDNLHPLGRCTVDNQAIARVLISPTFIASFKGLLLHSTEALTSESGSMKFYSNHQKSIMDERRARLMTRWGGMLFRLMVCDPFPASQVEYIPSSSTEKERAAVTVHLAIVNEMNLFPRDLIPPGMQLRVSVAVLDGQREMRLSERFLAHEVKISSELLDFYYPGLSFNGFYGSSKGAASFCLVEKNADGRQEDKEVEEVYLQFSLANIDSEAPELLVVPLILGPFQVSSCLSAQTESQQLSAMRPIYISETEFVPVKESVSDIPGKVWDSAFFVSSAVYEHYCTLKQQQDRRRPISILDLSTGNGAVGLSTLTRILRQKTSTKDDDIPRLTLTDLDEALPLIRENTMVAAGLNPQQREFEKYVDIREYTWGAKSEALAFAPFDVVLACDLIYENEFFADLVTSLEQLCTPGLTTIFVGYKDRGLTANEKDEIFGVLQTKFLTERVTLKSVVAPGFGAVSNDDVGVEVWKLWRV
ncbi:putative methyltransferase-domain-containing protein [Myxozyma melibiosi]|uniref:Methyltransferase-domain-containing protein n=1 Tax=Myxozyma melibiosi TaxID=54550 RepID=A0ABR1FCY3_9ASCO